MVAIKNVLLENNGYKVLLYVWFTACSFLKLVKRKA
jgi:hypothetical protein